MPRQWGETGSISPLSSSVNVWGFPRRAALSGLAAPRSLWGFEYPSHAAELQELAESSAGRSGLLSFPLQLDIRPSPDTFACGMLGLLVGLFTLKPNEGTCTSATDQGISTKRVNGEMACAWLRPEPSLSPSQQWCVF